MSNSPLSHKLVEKGQIWVRKEDPFDSVKVTDVNRPDSGRESGDFGVVVESVGEQDDFYPKPTSLDGRKFVLSFSLQNQKDYTTPEPQLETPNP